MIEAFFSTYRFDPSWSGFVLEAKWIWLVYIIVGCTLTRIIVGKAVKILKGLSK